VRLSPTRSDLPPGRTRIDRAGRIGGGASTEARSPVDGPTLASLCALETDQPGFLATLVHEFDGSFRERLADMRAALREKDTSALQGAAHSLKGSSAIVGALRMADICGRLEGLARRGLLAGTHDVLTRLEREHDAVLPVLRAMPAPEVQLHAVAIGQQARERPRLPPTASRPRCRLTPRLRSNQTSGRSRSLLRRRRARPEP
jgi:HPt (histidine-containing phosphotransfer) domain-containing protein